MIMKFAVISSWSSAIKQYIWLSSTSAQPKYQDPWACLSFLILNEAHCHQAEVKCSSQFQHTLVTFYSSFPVNLLVVTWQIVVLVEKELRSHFSYSVVWHSMEVEMHFLNYSTYLLILLIPLFDRIVQGDASQTRTAKHTQNLTQQ